MVHKEIEVKILEIDLAAAIAKLQELGAIQTFDGDIAAEFFRNEQGQKLRLRKMGRETILTFKKANKGDGVMDNEECEVACSSYEQMREILLGTGFTLYGKSHKHRTTYRWKDIVFDIDVFAGAPAFIEVESTTKESVQCGVEILGYTMEQTSTLTERGIKERYGIA